MVSLPVQFYLKDQLHLGPQPVALFGAVAAIPLYLGFTCGFLRDRWRPLGRGDRGYFLILAPAGILAYVWMACGAVTYGRLLAAVLLTTLLFQVLLTSVNGLLTSVAQRRLMTGRLGAVTQIVGVVPGVVAALLGGWLVSRSSARGIFVIAACMTAAFLAQAFWKPKAVFAGEPDHAPRNAGGFREVLRLARHRPIWPAAAISLIWNFGPGFQTPLFFHLTDPLKFSGDAVGVFTALLAISFVPTALLYGFACRRRSLRSLLWWGTAFAVPQALPILLCHSYGGTWRRQWQSACSEASPAPRTSIC